MPNVHPTTEETAGEKTWGLAGLFAAFFLSGISGLIYQTVWVRMLTRYLGSTTAATATVLCVFMGGLALGAWLGGRLSDRIKRQLFGYVILELCIASSAILMSFLIISVLGGFYVNFYPWFGGHAVGLAVARIIFCMACLLPPTVLMGATLPLLVSFVTRRKYRFQRGLGQLYSINTFGAVLGVFITGFVLIGELGEHASLYSAALLNLLAAFLVYRIKNKLSALPVESSPVEDQEDAKPELPSPYPAPLRIWSGIAIFVSGFSALAYEILWTRFLTLPLKTSIYAFSLMLGIFLIGIALGSALSIRFKISETRPVALFALFEILIGFLTVAGLVVFLGFGQLSEGFMGSYAFGILTAFLIVFPVAVVFGWQFPVAVRCCLSDASRPGQETGWAYAANTVGAIGGSIIGGFILIPVIGTANSFMLLAVVNTGIGLILLWLAPKSERGELSVFASLMMVVFVLMVVGVGDPYKKVIHERVVKMMGKDAQIYAFHEGVAGNTVPAGSPKHRLSKHLLINGTGMTTLLSETKLMAHLPLSLVPDPKRILVICFGMGTTVRSASKYPAGGTAIDISAVDIVPKVFDCYKYFHNDADRIVALSNVHLFADDGRNFLLTHDGGYDVITIDPAPPLHSAGTVNLYTREFFELCKTKLAPAGIVCMWLPPAPMTESLMIMKTFVNTFPGATLWGGLGFSGFYLIGGHRLLDQTDETLSVLAGKLGSIEDLREWDAVYGDSKTLRQLYLMGSKDFEMLVKDINEVTDNYPYTEFPIWRGVLTRTVPYINANAVRKYVQTHAGQSVVPADP